jgi:hypothetical protein
MGEEVPEGPHSHRLGQAAAEVNLPDTGHLVTQGLPPFNPVLMQQLSLLPFQLISPVRG